jgi:tetratricopeptide (TPR) repeat protein
VLGTTLEDTDRSFFAHLRGRFAGPLANLKEFEAQRTLGATLYQQKKLAEALPHLERARAAFPEYGGEGNPYWLLARIYKEQGAPEKAGEALTRLTAINESHYQANLELALAREEQHDVKGALTALDRALYIWPFDAGLHQRLAALSTRQGDRAAVVRARRSLVALDPVDRPEALYQLALALVEAGEPVQARREVLRALELAPRFQRAQELLLRLHREGPARGGGA